MALFNVDVSKIPGVTSSGRNTVFSVEAENLNDAERLISIRLGVPFATVDGKVVARGGAGIGIRPASPLNDAIGAGIVQGRAGSTPSEASRAAITEEGAQTTPSTGPTGLAPSATIEGQNEAGGRGAAIGGEGEGFVNDPAGPPTDGVTLGAGQPVPDPAAATTTAPGAFVGSVQEKATFLQQLLSGGFTPEELIEFGPIIQQMLADDPTGELALLLGPVAIQELGRIAEASIAAAGAVEQQGIASNPFGRSAEEDAALQSLIARGGISEEDAVRIAEIAARAGITSPFALLATNQITIEDIQKLERIAASGGLSDEDTIAEIQRQLARGEIDNPFAFVSAGFDINDAERLVNAQQSAANAAVNAQLQGVQAQREGQFLDFIGNASGVGSAVGFGFDPQSFSPFSQQGQQGGQTAIPLDALTEAVGASPEGQVPLDFLRSQNTPGTQSLGSFRSTPANATEASVRGFSDEELDFTEGQLATQGITPSAADRRRRSFTPGTRQPTGASVSGF